MLDAYANPRYDRIGGQPIEDDRKLAEAAIAAVRQYIFKPARNSGEPIAVWVATVVRFQRQTFLFSSCLR